MVCVPIEFSATDSPLTSVSAWTSIAWNRRLFCGPKVLHVDGGDVQRRVEAVARQVARVVHDAVVEVDMADGEGAGAGLEVAAGVDDDLGVADAVQPWWR